MKVRGEGICIVASFEKSETTSSVCEHLNCAYSERKPPEDNKDSCMNCKNGIK